MILRFIKFGWAVSLLASFATLIYVYASLPEYVLYSSTSINAQGDTVTRETFFYISLGFIAGINFVLYAITKNVKYRIEKITEVLKNGLLSLAISMNLFFIIIMNFIQFLNSPETNNLSYFGYLVYVILAIIVIVIIAIPIFMVRAAKNK